MWMQFIKNFHVGIVYESYLVFYLNSIRVHFSFSDSY